MPSKPPEPSKHPQRFSETFARKPARSPRGLVPGRRVWAGLGWGGALAGVCALGISLASSGVFASDDDEVPAASSVRVAPPTPSPTPTPTPTPTLSPKSAPPARTPAKTPQKAANPAAPQAPANPGTVVTVTATAKPKAPAAKKTAAAQPKATAASTPSQDFSRPVGQISGHYDGFVGKCVQLVGSALKLYGCDGGSDQKWKFAANGTLQQGDRCLSLAGRSTNDGTRVVMAACDSTTVTQWRVSGAYDIVNVAADKCLDVANASTANGSPLQIAWCSGNAAQKWTVP